MSPVAASLCLIPRDLQEPILTIFASFLIAFMGESNFGRAYAAFSLMSEVYVGFGVADLTAPAPGGSRRPSVDCEC